MKRHSKSYHSDIKYHMTLNIILSVVPYSVECGTLHEIETNVNLTISLGKGLEAPSTTSLNIDGNLSLLGQSHWFLVVSSV